MKKSNYIIVIAVLSAVILILLSYITFTNNSSLLQIAINSYLKKYNITLNFKKLNIKSKSSISIGSLILKTKGVYAKIPKFSVELTNKGSLVIEAVNPEIKVNPNKILYKQKNNIFIPLLKIKTLNAYNSTIEISNSTIQLKVTKANIQLIKNNIEFSGKITFRQKNCSLIMTIKQAKGIIYFSNNSILISKLFLNPKIIEFTKGNASLVIKQPLLITNLLIKISPFSFNFGSINTARIPHP